MIASRRSCHRSCARCYIINYYAARMRRRVSRSLNLVDHIHTHYNMCVGTSRVLYNASAYIIIIIRYRVPTNVMCTELWLNARAASATRYPIVHCI